MITPETAVFYGMAILVGIISTARITRLITQDTFPPSAWLRSRWDGLTEESPWNTLMHCHWCLAPWIIIPVAAWGFLADFNIWWWLVNGWLAASYLASIFVEHDEVAN